MLDLGSPQRGGLWAGNQPSAGSGLELPCAELGACMLGRPEAEAPMSCRGSPHNPEGLSPLMKCPKQFPS